jgi:hypothetical protein
LREEILNTDSFYAILSGICFALTGLWWSVVEHRKDWLVDPKLRSLAGGVYASFLVPGVMALGAQIGGDNKAVWRAVFVVASLAGIFFTSRLNSHMRKNNVSGAYARGRWVVVLLYVIVMVLGILPGLVAFTGLQPIQVEAFMLCMIILNGHGLAWEMMTSKPE